MSRLRVVTLNVHGWRDKNEVPNRWRILELLQRTDAEGG